MCDLKDSVLFFWQTKTLRRIFVSLLLVAVLPFCMTMLLSIASLNLIDREQQGSRKIAMGNAEREIGRAFENANVVNYRISVNSELLNYLNVRGRDYYTEYRLSAFLHDSMAGDQLINRIFLYFPEDDYVIADECAAEGDYYYAVNYGGDAAGVKSLLLSLSSSVYVSLPGANASSSIGRCAALRFVHGKYRSCAIVVEIHTGHLLSNIRSILWHRDDHIYVRSAGNVVLSTLEATPAKQLSSALRRADRLEAFTSADGNRYRLSHRALSPYTLDAVSLYDTGSAIGNIHRARSYSIVCLVACVLLTLPLSLYLSRKNYVPLETLLRKLQIRTDRAKNEYEVLEEVFRETLSHNQRLSQTIDQNEQRLRRLYLQNLFLGNVSETESVADVIRLYGLDFTEEYFAVAVFQRPFMSASEKEKTGISRLFADILSDSIPSLLFYPVDMGERIAFVLNADAETAESLPQDWAEIILSEAGLSEMCEMAASAFLRGAKTLPDCYAQASERLIQKRRAAASAQELRAGAGIAHGCIELIKARYADSALSVVALAEALDLNASYLSRYFKQQVGMGLLEYIHRYRVQRAKEILSEIPDIPLGELAARTGFYNAAALIRVFKKVEKVTPGQYRENAQCLQSE